MRTIYRALIPIIAAAAVALGAIQAPAVAAPVTPNFGPAIDAYASYDGQDTCDPTAKPGVVGNNCGIGDADLFPSCGNGLDHFLASPHQRACTVN